MKNKLRKLCNIYIEVIDITSYENKVTTASNKIVLLLGDIVIR